MKPIELNYKPVEMIGLISHQCLARTYPNDSPTSRAPTLTATVDILQEERSRSFNSSASFKPP